MDSGVESCVPFGSSIGDRSSPRANGSKSESVVVSFDKLWGSSIFTQTHANYGVDAETDVLTSVGLYRGVLLYLSLSASHVPGRRLGEAQPENYLLAAICMLDDAYRKRLVGLAEAGGLDRSVEAEMCIASPCINLEPPEEAVHSGETHIYNFHQQR